MRKIILLFAVICFAVNVFGAGAFTKNATEVFDKSVWQYIEIEGEIDSTETMNTSVFSLDDYRSQYFIESPILAGYKFTKDTVGDTVNTTVTVYGSVDGVNFIVCDTIATVTTETYAVVELDFNNRMYTYYKVRLVGGTGNHNDIDFDIRIAIFKRNDVIKQQQY